MSDGLRKFRKYTNGVWESVMMDQLNQGDIILVEDIYDCYYIVMEGKRLHKELKESSQAITVDTFILSPDMKPFWKNLNPDAEHVTTIRKEIAANNGQCCCVVKSKQSEDTMCPCKAYRTTRKCICQLYIDE